MDRPSQFEIHFGLKVAASFQKRNFVVVEPCYHSLLTSFFVSAVLSEGLPSFVFAVVAEGSSLGLPAAVVGPRPRMLGGTIHPVQFQHREHAIHIMRLDT